MDWVWGQGWAGPALEPKRRQTKRMIEKIWALPELSSPEYPHHSCILPAHVMKKCVGPGARWRWVSRSVMPNSCDPIDCSPPGSSVHGILQAGILEWVAISFSRVSSRPTDPTWVSCIAGRFFTNRAIREALVWPDHPFLPSHLSSLFAVVGSKAKRT